MLFLKFQPDFFKGKDLSHLYLPGLECRVSGKADFTGTSFQGSEISDADLSDVILTNANLRDTILKDVSFGMDGLFASLAHPEEHLLVINSFSYLLLLNTETNSIVKKIQAEKLRRVKLSQDQKHIVAICENRLKFIALETFTIVSEYTFDTSNDEQIDSFDFGDSPDVMICGGDDHSIYFWNIRENKILRTFHLEYEQWSDFNEITVSPNKKYILASTPETFQIWDIALEKMVFLSTLSDKPFLDDIIFHPIEEHVIVVKEKSDIIEIFSLNNFSSIRSIQAESNYKRLYFNNDGSLLAVVYTSKIVLYDYHHGRIISECDGRDIDSSLFSYSNDSLKTMFTRRNSD